MQRGIRIQTSAGVSVSKLISVPIHTGELVVMIGASGISFIMTSVQANSLSHPSLLYLAE